MAAKICPFLWKNCGSFNSLSATISISLGLDYNWHALVHKCKRLCKFVLIFLGLSSEDNFNSGGDMFNFLQLPEEGQKWGFLIWLLFSYCGLIGIACISVGKVIIIPCTSISLFNFTLYSLP